MPDLKRVLVVDRERFSTIICKMLEGRYGVESAFDGLSAVRMLRLATPDVIVVDQDIPGNGVRLVELIGMNPRLQKVGLILTSIKASPDMILRSRIAGVDSFLAKPFKPSDLLSRIEAVMERPPAPAPSAGPEASQCLPGPGCAGCGPRWPKA